MNNEEKHNNVVNKKINKNTKTKDKKEQSARCESEKKVVILNNSL